VFETVKSQFTLVSEMPPFETFHLKIKPKKMKQARFFLPLLMMGIIISATGFYSCNSADKKETTTDTTMQEKKADTMTVGGVSYLHTVLLTKQNLIDVLQTENGNNSIKMVYFELDIASPGNYSLRAHGADERGGRETGDFDLDIVSAGPTMQFTPGDNAYSQQITRGNLKAYIGIATGSNTPIDTKDLPDSIFLTPCTKLDENRETLIYFQMSAPYQVAVQCPTAPGTTSRGYSSTNPAPPGEPCLANCDNPSYYKKYTKRELNNANIKSKSN
jgi:hypothetical protein